MNEDGVACAECFSHFCRQFSLTLIILHASHDFHVLLNEFGEQTVVQSLVCTGNDFFLYACLSAFCRTHSSRVNPLGKIVEHVASGASDIVRHAGIFRHYVGCETSVSNDIVYSAGRQNVLA